MTLRGFCYSFFFIIPFRPVLSSLLFIFLCFGNTTTFSQLLVLYLNFYSFNKHCKLLGFKLQESSRHFMSQLYIILTNVLFKRNQHIFDYILEHTGWKLGISKSGATDFGNLANVPSYLNIIFFCILYYSKETFKKGSTVIKCQ